MTCFRFIKLQTIIRPAVITCSVENVICRLFCFPYFNLPPLQERIITRQGVILVLHVMVNECSNSSFIIALVDDYVSINIILLSFLACLVFAI